MEQLITTEYFKSLYDYAISTIDNSKIMKNIFYNLSSLEDLKKITPYLIILVEKYLRHLTDNQFSTKINIHKLREQVEKYLSDKKYIYKPYINTELLIDSDLFNQIQDKYNEAYYNILRELIQDDFYQNENKKPKGVLINRHIFLHGKFHFDKITNKNILQLTFLLRFLYQLEEQTKPVNPIIEE